MLNHNWQKDIYSDHENLDIFHLIHHYSFFFSGRMAGAASSIVNTNRLLSRMQGLPDGCWEAERALKWLTEGNWVALSDRMAVWESLVPKLLPCNTESLNKAAPLVMQFFPIQDFKQAALQSLLIKGTHPDARFTLPGLLSLLEWCPMENQKLQAIKTIASTGHLCKLTDPAEWRQICSNFNKFANESDFDACWNLFVSAGCIAPSMALLREAERRQYQEKIRKDMHGIFHLFFYIFFVFFYF